MKKFIRIGVDLGKNYFQVHALVSDVGPAVTRKLRRSKMHEFFSQIEPSLIGMEACGSAHGAGAASYGPRGSADPTDLRQALCQARQERRGRGTQIAGTTPGRHRVESFFGRSKVEPPLRTWRAKRSGEAIFGLAQGMADAAFNGKSKRSCGRAPERAPSRHPRQSLHYKLV